MSEASPARSGARASGPGASRARPSEAGASQARPSEGVAATEDQPGLASAGNYSDPVGDEQRSTPVELLWDLVFVFAVTQVTTLLADELTWAGFGRSMLVLALIWWAWSAFVWAANAQPATSPTLRLTLLVAAGFIFISGLAVPRAFGPEGTLFACCYAVVRLLHLGLYADASRRGNASWSAISGFAITVIVGMGLLVAGSFLSGSGRVVLWALAVAIDYAGPAGLTRERLRGIQHVSVAHFAERYGLFVIICLGESIVSIGAAALGAQARHARPLTVGVVTSVALCLLITIGLWSAYFTRSARAAELRLREHPDPVLAAADGYSYLHLPLVAGIIVFAVGARFLVRASASAPLSDAVRLVLCGGVALYLLAHLAFELRLGDIRRPGAGVARLLAGLAPLALYLVGGALAGAAVATLLVVILGCLTAAESLGAI